MNLNWFLSQTIRHSVQMRKHVRKLVRAQWDLLSPKATDTVQAALDDLKKAEHERPLNREAVTARMTQLEKVANEWLKPYPNASFRENIEVLLVAIAVAMGIRTFFLQPFKIPTGSMQPTLWGIENVNLIDQPEVEIPGRFNVGRFFEYWFNGVGYTHVVAKTDGRFQIIDERPSRFLLFNLRQKFRIGNEVHTVWFPPDNMWEQADLKAFGVPAIRHYKKGEDVIRLRTVSGDHLFVDRLTYNFRQPRLGEIIVFETRGINGLPQDQYYIKRLVAMGGDEVRLLNDRHLEINGTRLDSSTPHFELVYSFDENLPPRPNHYSGHVNGVVARNIDPRLSPLFPDGDSVYQVPEGHYLVMGDNPLRSFDSRAWGAFDKRNVIGKSFFIYWPIGQQPGQMGRFGWSHR